MYAGAYLKTSSSERAKLVRLKAWLASTVSDGHVGGMMKLCCINTTLPDANVFACEERRDTSSPRLAIQEVENTKISAQEWGLTSLNVS